MKQSEILKHIRNYNSTGIIDDALIPFFDQRGRWRGDQIRWNADILQSKFAAIQKAFLPSSRRTRKSRSGTVLRTSLCWRREEGLKIHYSRIEGSLIVPNNTHIQANELCRVGGDFVTNTTHRIQLPNLTVVGGDFQATQCLGLNAPQLRQVGGSVMISANVPAALETVGGSLRVHCTLSLVAPRLQFVGKWFTTHRCTDLVLPVLCEVGGPFITRSEGRIDAPLLRRVRGDFLVSAARVICAPSLRIVAGCLDSRSAKDFYHPAITVEGQWTTYPGAPENWICREKARMAMRGNPWPMYY